MEKIFVVIALASLLYFTLVSTVRWIPWLAMTSITILLVYRGITYKHFPVIGLFETLNFYSLSLLFFTYLQREKREQEKLITNIFTIILLALSLTAQSSTSPFTPDSLKTVLFPIHVAFSFLSYAAFTLAFIKVISKGDKKQVIELNYFGFVLFTIGLWAGGIWAFKAWGSYFLFSIKEIFSFVIWIYYGGLIHVRFFREKEKPLTYGTVIGFIIVIFTYLGIGLFMKNTHSL